MLGVGYALNLPYLSLWKTLNEAHAGRARGRPGLQRAARDRGEPALRAAAAVAGGPALGAWRPAPLAAGGHVATPLGVELGGVARRCRCARRLRRPARAPSQFPVFPFSAFVLAGTAAGAALGRQDARVRRRRAVRWGLGLDGRGIAGRAGLLAGRADFWLTSPGYTLHPPGRARCCCCAGVEALSRARRPCARWRSSAMRHCSSTCSTSTSCSAASSPAAPLGRAVGRLGLPAAFLTLAADGRRPPGRRLGLAPVEDQGPARGHAGARCSWAPFPVRVPAEAW